MATFNKYNQFVQDLAQGVHNFTSDATSSVTVALSNTAGDAVATKATLSQITQVAYTFLSSRIITGVTANQSSGTVTFTATDLVLTSTGGTTGPFQYVILYNDDPTSPVDPLIGWYDYGSALSLLTGETLTIDFTTGFATLA